MEWLEPYQETIAAFVKIELYIKVDGEWSMPIQGTGGSMFVEIQRSGPHVSDECYKMATTDAISVACKQLGIGADVYWDKDSTKYNNSSNRESSDTNNGVSQDQVKNEDEKKKIQEKRTEIEELCKKYNYTPEAICKSNNYIWEELLDETRLTNMLYSLKQGFGEE